MVAALGGAAGVAYAAGGQAPPTARAPARALPEDSVRDTVQVALLLDTSGSMDGLLNQARSQLWRLVDDLGRMTRVVDGKLRGVTIELAVYEYGNNAIPERVGFIRQVLPFTTDLDRVSEQLHTLVTSGGEEYVGQAITTSVAGLRWSTDPAALRFVFVAGNETFDQGPISAATAMAAAAGKDIHVQLIDCGSREPTWEAAARLAKSELLTIDHNGVEAYVQAPQDAEILRLGEQLNRTYLAYGADGNAAAERQVNADAASARLSPNAALERAQLKATRNYSNAAWDVVDAVEHNANFLAETGQAELPDALRGRPLAEQRRLVAAQAQRRAELRSQLAKLEAARTAFLAAARASQDSAAQASLETALLRSARKVAADKGYRL